MTTSWSEDVGKLHLPTGREVASEKGQFSPEAKIRTQSEQQLILKQHKGFPLPFKNLEATSIAIVYRTKATEAASIGIERLLGVNCLLKGALAKPAVAILQANVQ